MSPILTMALSRSCGVDGRDRAEVGRGRRDGVEEAWLTPGEYANSLYGK